jgi:hypothetical protein
MKFPLVIYKGLPKNDSWCRWIVHRVQRRNNSTNVRLVGDTGSGKSWSGLYVAEKCAKILGRKFDHEDIYFSIADVIKKVSEDEPKPGTIFFIDEQQVGANAKEHASKRNRAYAAFMSTVRSNRYIIITTLPFADMEDKQLRRLFHLEIETMGADLKNAVVTAKPRYLEHSRVNGKTYKKRLVVVFTDVKTGIIKSRKVSTWDIGKPSQPLINEYEKMKSEFKRKLYKKLNKELMDKDNEENGVKERGTIAASPDFVEATLTDFQLAILNYMKQGIKKYKELIPKLEEAGFKAGSAKICQNIKWMKKKGVVIIK